MKIGYAFTLKHCCSSLLLRAIMAIAKPQTSTVVSPSQVLPNLSAKQGADLFKGQGAEQPLRTSMFLSRHNIKTWVRKAQLFDVYGAATGVFKDRQSYAKRTRLHQLRC